MSGGVRKARDRANDPEVSKTSEISSGACHSDEDAEPMSRVTSTGQVLAPHAKTADVDVGLVYTHERQWMPRLLASLADACRGIAPRLLLVDNASDEGVDAWTGYLAETTVLRNRRRLFYAPNLNRILQASTARYVLVMNTDMYFDADEPCVERMIRFMDGHPECGVAGCGLYHEDGEFAYPARRFQSPAVVLARRCGLGRWMGRTLDDYLYRNRLPHDTWEPDWLSGAFLMIRREAFHDVGLFDEGFGKYFEDVDLCLRMALAGWKVLYHGGTYCYHLEHRGSKKLMSLDAVRHLHAYLHWHWKWGLFVAKPAASPQVPERRAA